MSTTAMYKQAGPSNFSKSYQNEGRNPSQYGAGRGRGRNAHMNNGYRQPLQQQPYYPSAMPYQRMPMNGSAMHDPYAHIQAGVNGHHPGPSYNTSTSPPLQPLHTYNPHAPPFIPQGPLPPPPMYPYPTHPAHMNPYATYGPPLHQTPYMYAPYQPPKSPMPSRTPEMNEAPQPAPSIASFENGFTSQQGLTKEIDETANADEQPSPVPSASVASPPVTDTPATPAQVSAPSSPLSAALDYPTPSHSRTASASSSRAILPSFSDMSLIPRQEWTISSHRPDDPSAAFGIIFSPRSKPPSHIVAEARECDMPKPSLRLTSLKTRSRKPATKSSKMGPSSSILHIGSPQRIETELAVGEEVESSATGVDPTSCSATESDSRASIAPDTFTAGSPISTATSFSVAVQKADAESESPVIAVSAPESQLPSASTVPKDEEPPVKVEVETAKPAVKKSWASLLRSDDPSSRSSLPKSSVQGFSIPGEDFSQSSSSSANAADGTDADLLKLLTQGPSGSMSPPQIRPRGLVNTGNMCFANAVLQTLVYTPPFYRLFSEIGKYVERSGLHSLDPVSKKAPMMDAMVEFLKEFKPKPKAASKGNKMEDDDDFEGVDSFIPSNVYEAMKEKRRFDGMGGGQQEDAEEFFGFFLDTLEEELLSVAKSLSPATPSAPASSVGEDNDWLEVGRKNRAVVTRTAKAAESPLSRIFGGKFRIALRVPGQRDSVTIEDWRSLHVEIQREEIHTIEDALRYISRPNAVPVSSVTKGGATVEASQQYQLDVLPPILVLHLKRFEYDTNVKDVVKISKQIVYGPELEVPSDAITPSRRSSQPVKYKLFAVVYHHGTSATSGHYTLDVLHPNRNSDVNARPKEGWIRIDDELVSDMRTEDVFPRERDCAYLLLYRRIQGGSYASKAG